MKKALILGGTGAMGGYLVDILSNSGRWDITVTSRQNRISHKANVKYIVGNARERHFMDNILQNEYYDVIVDFMNYGYEEFKERFEILLKSTKHYVFLSSSRVYAESEFRITEESPRLLDVTSDNDFLKTQRYALRKARQEDMLRVSGMNNWTIVHPYITYSSARLQLGIYEKEQWLYRLLNCEPLVIRKDILSRETSLTSGKDVSLGISRIMGNSESFGEAVHITTSETMSWKDILELYLDVLENITGKRYPIYVSDYFPKVEECFEGGYNTKYDRLFNRSFDNTKARRLCGDIEYTPMKEGLASALQEFIRNGSNFLNIQTDFEALLNRMTGCKKIGNFDSEYRRYYCDEEFREVDDYKYSEWIKEK